MSKDSKRAIRQEVRRRRQALTPDAQYAAGWRLGQAARQLRAFRSASRIAAYLANDSEISPEWIVAFARAEGRQCFTPLIQGNRKGARLVFAPWDTENPWKANRYGIPEPDVSPRRCLRPEMLDLIFVPLVAFDAAGRRLGMGGGFYDRTLEARGRRQKWRKPTLIGIAHECQRVDEVPTNDRDVPLDGILTDAAYYQLDTT